MIFPFKCPFSIFSSGISRLAMVSKEISNGFLWISAPSSGHVQLDDAEDRQEPCVGHASQAGKRGNDLWVLSVAGGEVKS